MTTRLSFLALTIISGLPLAAQNSGPRQNGPVIGYVYPAGAQAGGEIDVTVGGLALGTTTGVRFSGGVLSATILKHRAPINGKLQNEIREMIQIEREKPAKSGVGSSGGTKKGKGMKFLRDEEILQSIAAKEGISQDVIDSFLEDIAQKRDPKHQQNAQLAERVTLRVKVPAHATTGRHELRLLGLTGLSNPLAFMVGKLPEVTESEPNSSVAAATATAAIPCVLNGQILPGDVDDFTFEARKGMKLTAAVAARDLTPYLADAVPGWFQANLLLLDSKGSEVAFNDSFEHRPDPLLCAAIPADGRYILQVTDSLNRGREDFVYRITLGEIPCLTEQYPLGGKIGTTVPVRVSGWNLRDYQAAIEVGDTPGSQLIPPRPPILGFMQFDAGVDPETVEPDVDAPSAMKKSPGFPCVTNGIIRRPGEIDVYPLRFKAGQKVIAETRARRLGSPLDSMIRVLDPAGALVTSNDDRDDPESGLLTHHADSRVELTVPKDGIYQFAVSDTQSKGSRAHAYRLLITPPRPDFALRVVPSALNGRAGSLVPVTAHVVRRDGFTGEVTLDLVEAPAGYSLIGGKVPAGADSVELTLKIANDAAPGVCPLEVAGSADIGGKTIRHPGRAADDRMQAFFYRHLVPADALLACVTGNGKNAKPGLAMLDRLQPLCAKGVDLSAGSTAIIKFPRPQGAKGELVFSLINPSSGITLTGNLRDGFIELVFAAPPMMKPGPVGNLIVQVSAKTQTTSSPDKPKKTNFVKLGVLPPIPCRIIGSVP